MTTRIATITGYLVRSLAHLPIFYKVLIANSLIVVTGAVAGTTLTLLSTGSTEHLFELVTLFTITGTFLSVLINWIVLRAAFRPIDVLEQTADEVRRGNFHVRAPSVPLSDPDLENLTATFNAMLDTLVGYQQRLRELSQRVLTAQEEERQRIARELHDDPAQSLTALLVLLKMLHDRQQPTDGRTLQELIDLTTATLESIRAIAQELRPPVLDDFGLAAALEGLAAQYWQRFGLPVHVYVRGQRQRLSPEIELALYRIAQEALTNVAKHADATHATIDLQFREGTVSLRIEDDGRGFEPREGLGRGLGLFGMRERAELVHGTFALESEPGHGTRITVAVPLESRTQFASTTGVRA